MELTLPCEEKSWNGSRVGIKENSVLEGSIREDFDMEKNQKICLHGIPLKVVAVPFKSVKIIDTCQAQSSLHKCVYENSIPLSIHTREGSIDLRGV